MPAHIDDWIGIHLNNGRYQVTAKLGEGGMGAVYRARDANLDTDVVIKVPHPQMLRDGEFAARFSREIRSLVQLSHPHVVKILDVGQNDGLPFAVMQYLPGGSLEDRRVLESPGHPLATPAEEIAAWLEDVADALDFIHSQNYIHRDIKPGNILFDAHGNVFLSDFGVAKAIADDASTPGASQLTGTGMVLGTPDYMAPEVVMGRACDGRADQYALAVMLFELLSGRLPFVGPNPTSVLVAHSTQPVPDVREVCPRVSAAVAAVIHRGLAKAPAERFPTCKALALAFHAAIRSTGAGVVETVVRQHCPVCRQVLRVAEKAAGQCVPCPGCKTPLQISPDRQEIAIAGSAPAVYAGTAPAEHRERATRPVQSATVPTAQPRPALLPQVPLSRKRLVLAACAGCAVLIILVVVAASLIGRRGDEVAGTTATPHNEPTLPPRSDVPQPQNDANTPLSRPAAGDEMPGDLPKELGDQDRPAQSENGNKQGDDKDSRPAAIKEADPTPPSLSEPSALPATKKHQPPPLDFQVAIARNLDRQYGLRKAELPAEKNRLAHGLLVFAATEQATPDNHFVFLRLAADLYEVAGSVQDAHRTRMQIAEKFDIDPAVARDSLLGRLGTPSPFADPIDSRPTDRPRSPDAPSSRGPANPGGLPYDLSRMKPELSNSNSGSNSPLDIHQTVESDAVAIQLPTAETFHTSKFDVPNDKVDQLIDNWTKGDPRIVGVMAGNDQLRVLARHDKGYPSGGPLIVFNANDDFEYYVDFDDDRHKDGLLKTWDQSGQRSYWCEYKMDRKHGYCCLFDNDQLTAIAQYENDKLTSLAIIEGNQVKQHFPNADAIVADSKAQELANRLKKQDDEVKLQVIDLRKQVKEEEQNVRQARTARLATINRRMIAQRMNQRRAENARNLKSRQQHSIRGR